MAEDIVSRLVLQGQQYFSTINQAHQRTQKFQKDSQAGFRNVTGAIQAATKALVAYGAVRILQVIGRQISETARLGDELAKMSQRTGLAVEFLNGFVQTAGVADVSTESLSVGVRTLNKNLLDMTQGTGEAKDSFEAMGISAVDAGQLLKTPEDSLIKVLDLLSRIPDASRRGAVAQELLGRSGTDWLPLINQGTEAIKRQIAEFQKLRPITTEQARAAEAYNDSLTELTFAFEGLMQRGIGPLLPALTRTIELMTELVSLDTDALGFRFKTLGQDLFASLKLINDLLADPLNYAETLKKYEALDKQFMEERRKRFAGPEKPALTPTLETVQVTAKAPSAETASLIALRQAELDLLEIQEKQLAAQENREAILTAAQRHLKAEVVLLQQNLTVQKEIEDAKKDKREVDPNVAQAASLKARADLVALALEEEALTKAQNAALEKQRGLQQEILGTDIQHAAALHVQATMRDLSTRAAQSQHDLEVAQLNPLQDAAQLRGQEILTLRDWINLLNEQNEVLGETVERHRDIEIAQARINALVAEGAALNQESLGRGIVQAATSDIQRRLEVARRAVRDAQQELEKGEASPNQLPETNRLRRIELLDKELALLDELRRVGELSTEEFNRQFILKDAQLRSETTHTQQGFLEGWQATFQQFAEDAKGAFGLGQTLARNFVTNIQQGFAGIITNIFDQLEQKTLTWRTALQTIPDILKQITSQLISMALTQGIASAIGGGVSGLFGPGAGSGAIAGPRTAAGQFFPQLGFATGGSFIVGGPGGTDRTPVNFMATRGERVTVETPGQQHRGGFTVNINNYGTDVQTHERVGPQGGILDITVRRIVRDEVQRGPTKTAIHRSIGVPIRGRVG